MGPVPSTAPGGPIINFISLASTFTASANPALPELVDARLGRVPA